MITVIDDNRVDLKEILAFVYCGSIVNNRRKNQIIYPTGIRIESTLKHLPYTYGQTYVCTIMVDSDQTEISSKIGAYIVYHSISTSRTSTSN